MLPHLQYLRGTILALFISFASRTNQMKTLDTVDLLVLVDQVGDSEICFSLKQWFTVLDVLPRLRTLFIKVASPRCPSIGLADLFVSYIKRTIRVPLTLFSCTFLHSNETDKKEHFISYLTETIGNEYQDVQFADLSSTSIDIWM